VTTLVAPPPTVARACPKCGHPVETGVTECTQCHVIIAKAVKAEVRAAEERREEADGWLGRLAEASAMTVMQQVETAEAWTGIETANSYVIRDETGHFVLHAEEQSGSVAGFLLRNWLKAQRPFTIQVTRPEGETLLVLERPFRLFFSEVNVFDAFGKPLGSVRRQLSFFNSIYKLTGRLPTDNYEIFGPFFRAWTFRIRKHGQECGLIRKKWSGLRKEMLTDADSFGIEFPPGISGALKAVFLGAVFLLDFAHFEDNNR
jgi:hypothetical protein